MMDNCTYCVLNEARMYPLEKMLRCLAKAQGSYVIAVFDCCREDFKRYQRPAKPTRGREGQASTSLAEEDEAAGITAELRIIQENCDKKQIENHENFIITYGCKPSDGVPAKSTISKNYFRYLHQSASNGKSQGSDHTKFFVLPGCLNFFQNSDGKCEHSIKVSGSVILEWDDSVPNDSNVSYGNMESKSQVSLSSDFEGGSSASVGFFDFTEAVKTPHCTLKFTNTRMLQCLCILPKCNHLLLEGGLFD